MGRICIHVYEPRTCRRHLRFYGIWKWTTDADAPGRRTGTGRDGKKAEWVLQIRPEVSPIKCAIRESAVKTTYSGKSVFTGSH